MASLDLHGQTLLQRLEFKEGRRDPEQKDTLTDSKGSPTQMDSPFCPHNPSRQGWVRAGDVGSFRGGVSLPEDLCQLGKQSPGHFRAPLPGPGGHAHASSVLSLWWPPATDSRASVPQGCLSLSEEQPAEGYIFQIPKRSQRPGMAV